MTIDQIQEEIIEEFAVLKGDFERIMCHLVSLGHIMPEMPVIYRVDDNLIKGCHSKLWLAAERKTNRLHLHADSDTIISKGLASLLLRVFNGQNCEDILGTDLYFIRRNHLERFIGTKRSNGFQAMIDQIKYLARHP